MMEKLTLMGGLVVIWYNVIFKRADECKFMRIYFVEISIDMIFYLIVVYSSFLIILIDEFIRIVMDYSKIYKQPNSTQTHIWFNIFHCIFLHIVFMKNLLNTTWNVIFTWTYNLGLTWIDFINSESKCVILCNIGY